MRAVGHHADDLKFLVRDRDTKSSAQSGSGQEEIPPDVADVVTFPHGHGDTRHLASTR